MWLYFMLFKNNFIYFLKIIDTIFVKLYKIMDTIFVKLENRY